MPITLWRPTARAELDLVAGSGRRAWPPCLPEYRSPVAEDFGPLPAAWRAYLTGESWFRPGWLASGVYLQLYRPAEAVEHLAAWPSVEHPGIAWLGDDGSRERFAIDLRHPDSPVFVVEITSAGWSDALRVADSVEALVASIEDGSLAYH